MGPRNSFDDSLSLYSQPLPSAVVVDRADEAAVAVVADEVDNAVVVVVVGDD